MAGLPWSKWFWADWRSDPGLRACTAQARGVWMDCLCIAAESSPTGYVLVNGRTPTTTDLARLTGEPEAVVQSSLEELERNGVFSRDHNGRIYNRRMVRDAKRIASDRKVGKQGGNPNIRRGTVPKADRVRPFRRGDSPAKTRRIFDKSGGACHWCNVPLVWESEELVPNFFHVDHVIAVCDGGTNEEGNLVASCGSCNHARARKDWVNPSDTNPDNNPDTKAKKPDARSLEAKSETEPSTAEVVPLAPRAKRASSYAFEGRVIRLTSEDFERWRTSFHGVPDLAAELTVIDIWLFDRNQGEGWFHRTAGMLNRKHQELQAQKQETAKRPWERPWTIGVG